VLADDTLADLLEQDLATLGKTLEQLDVTVFGGGGSGGQRHPPETGRVRTWYVQGRRKCPAGAESYPVMARTATAAAV
jgi:hypothetical protein